MPWISDALAVEEAPTAVPAPEVLLAPAALLALLAPWACQLGRGVVTMPEPIPASGLTVSCAEMPCLPLPAGWAGVWARAEPLPAGPWVPLPPAALADPQALLQALQAAETWRCERWALAQHTIANAQAMQAVNEIGIALSAERDPDRVLDLILTRARHLVAADAGSIYLVQQGETEHHYLYFALAQNDSVTAPWKASVIPLNPYSVAGTVALRGEVVVVDDVYALPPDGALRHDQSFDQRFHYRTRSVVGIPLASRDHGILGVLQLINRKPHVAVPLAEPTRATEVVPFSPSDVELLRSLASQAAVSLENSRFYEDIQQLFEGFVRAAIMAIEQRDPTTSGHSFRVADGTIALAQSVERLQRGPWGAVRFTTAELRELRYAALLHDFGKVGVRENVLTKAMKLFDEELTSLQTRFRLARASLRAERRRLWVQHALDDPEGFRHRLPQLEAQLDQELIELEAMQQIILRSNNPNILEAGDYSALTTIRLRGFHDSDGEYHTLLTNRELQMLSLRRGNLTPTERQEIEKHVTHSFNFLRTIPWTRDLARVPDLAGRHHEKLDGSGYPDGLTADDIPLGTRMMTIADIFDALVARDRPYKKAVPLARALSILEDEARAGKLDTALVEIWIEAKAWESIGTY